MNKDISVSIGDYDVKIVRAVTRAPNCYLEARHQDDKNYSLGRSSAIYHMIRINPSDKQKLRELGFAVADTGVYPEFIGVNEAIRFLEWVKTSISTSLQYGDTVMLNEEEWEVRSSNYLCAVKAYGFHREACRKLLDRLNTLGEESYDSILAYAKTHGFSCADGLFPVFETKEELTQFYNHLKQQLNEVQRVTETDIRGDQTRGTYSPGKAKLFSTSARHCGNAISVGKIKSRIATAKKKFSSASL